MILILLAGGALCTFRWRAWYAMPDEPAFTGEMRSHHFRILTEDSTPDSLRLLILGDVHNSLEREDWMRLDSLNPGLDGLLQLGDLLERPYFYYEQMLYQQMDSTIFDTLPILVVPGNHEYRKGIFPAIDPLWGRLFAMPQNGPKGFEGRSYFVDLPFVRLIGLDTQGQNHLIDYTRHLYWLHQTMDGAGDRYVVVMMHHPAYSCAEGRQNYLIRWLYGHVLDEADLVLAGHDHAYSRRNHHVVTNASTKHYPHAHPDAACNIEHRRLYLRLEGTVDTLWLRTYDLESGEQLDEFVINR